MSIWLVPFYSLHRLRIITSDYKNAGYKSDRMLQVDKRINHTMNIEGLCSECTRWHLLLKYLLVSLEAADPGKALGVAAPWKRRWHKPHRPGWRSRAAPLRVVCSCGMKSKHEKKTPNCPFDVFDLGSACVPLSAL